MYRSMQGERTAKSKGLRVWGPGLGVESLRYLRFASVTHRLIGLGLRIEDFGSRVMAQGSGLGPRTKF